MTPKGTLPNKCDAPWGDLPIVEGFGLTLRPIQMDDSHLIISWRNNPNVRKNFIIQDLLTLETHERWMTERVATGKVVQYIIMIDETGQPVGSVYFQNIDGEAGTAEFGIFIGSDAARGRGIGSKATRLFSEFGFSHLGLNRIFLRVFEDNFPALRCYLKVGFAKDESLSQTIEIDGQEKRIVFMSLGREDLR